MFRDAVLVCLYSGAVLKLILCRNDLFYYCDGVFVRDQNIRQRQRIRPRVASISLPANNIDTFRANLSQPAVVLLIDRLHRDAPVQIAICESYV